MQGQGRSDSWALWVVYITQSIGYSNVVPSSPMANWPLPQTSVPMHLEQGI